MSQQQEFDWHEIIAVAHELGDQLIHSERLYQFQKSREAMQSDDFVSQQINRFHKAKEKWEDTDRFGVFHPSYQDALQLVQKEQDRLESLDLVITYKNSEKALDELLYKVSETIARAVSEQIKVPGNDMQHTSGCGGNCNGGCA